MQAGETFAGARHLSIFLFDADLTPQIVCAISNDGSDVSQKAAASFVRRGLHRIDPLRALLASGRADGHASVQMFSVDDRVLPADQKRYYEELGLTGRLAIYNRARPGWLSINFYRTTQSPDLDPEMLDKIAAEADVLHALAGKHLELTSTRQPVQNTGDMLQQRLAKLSAGLTPREMQVCISALQGATNAEIAADLGVEPTTVSTLRHRAYDRLGVSTIVELFLRCLSVQP